MDITSMAPPSKRRKLADWYSGNSLSSDNIAAAPENLPVYTHAVESLPAHSALNAPWTTSSGSTEQSTRSLQPAVGGIEDFNVLVPRQGTLLNSVDSAVNSIISGVTSIVSATAAVSLSASVSTSADATSTNESTTASSSGSSTTNTSSSSTGNSSSNSSASASAISTPISNDTSTSATASSLTTGPASFPANSTSSTLVSGSSSRNTSIRASPTSTTATSTESPVFYLATLSDGHVLTISRNDSAFTTTFSDGQIFTIPAVSTSSDSASSEATGTSAVVTTTVIQVTSMASSGGELSTITSTATIGGAGANGEGSPTSTSASTSTTSSAGDDGGSNNNSTPPPATIAGGVVGGAAGLAALVLIAMLFIRWYRRKGQMGIQALPPGSIDSPYGDGVPEISQGPGMAERAGLMPVMASLPAFFRHQNRSTEGPAPSERGFTRVSGRKLPSAFSEGMTSEVMSRPGLSHRASPPPPQMPLMSRGLDRDSQENPFYRDSEGSYEGTGDDRRSISPNSPGSDIPIRQSRPDLMAMLPGPQRQPQIHSGGPYHMSPTGDDVHKTATFDRSETPSTLRNSRFTEDM